MARKTARPTSAARQSTRARRKPPTPAVTASPAAHDAPRRLKMKDLERATGVGRESIRFYIREGLLPEPDRPGRNVAYYDESFVERVRFIKELQQKRYLPLQVIKAIVAGEAAPSASEVETLLALNGKLFPQLEGARAATPEMVCALAARTGLPVREIEELGAVEVVRIVERDGERWIEGAEVRLIELWARLRQAGVSAELGFEPSQARLYVDMVRWLAREELRLFSKYVGGKVPLDQAARMAEEGIEVINQVIGVLRRQTLLRYVGEGNVPTDARGSSKARHPRVRGRTGTRTN